MDELTLLRQIADAAFTVRDRQRRYVRHPDTRIYALMRDAQTHLDGMLKRYKDGDYNGQADFLDSS